MIWLSYNTWAIFLTYDLDINSRIKSTLTSVVSKLYCFFVPSTIYQIGHKSWDSQILKSYYLQFRADLYYLWSELFGRNMIINMYLHLLSIVHTEMAEIG